MCWLRNVICCPECTKHIEFHADLWVKRKIEKKYWPYIELNTTRNCSAEKFTRNYQLLFWHENNMWTATKMMPEIENLKYYPFWNLLQGSHKIKISILLVISRENLIYSYLRLFSVVYISMRVIVDGCQISVISLTLTYELKKKTSKAAQLKLQLLVNQIPHSS